MAQYRAIKIKLDPSPKQKVLFNRYAGAKRYAWNQALAHVIEQIKNKDPNIDWSYYDLRKWWNGVKDEKAPWWKECSKHVYNSAFEALGDALKAFSNSKKGKRKGPPCQFPKHKKYGQSDSFTFTVCPELRVHDQTHLVLPRIGKVHALEPLPNVPIQRLTISRSADYWYASLMYKVEDEAPVEVQESRTLNMVGIDLGVKNLATLSDGTIIPKSTAKQRKDRKVKRLQRQLDRKKKGSNRREVAKKKLAKAHLVAAQNHEDYLQRVTTWIADRYDAVALESLAVKNMSRKGGARKRGLNRAIQNAGLRRFRLLLETKMKTRNKTGAFIDRFNPTSKTCYNCRTVKPKLSLSERVYICEVCGYRNDRDMNAANNIAVAGSTPETLNGRGGSVSPLSSPDVKAIFDETSIKQGMFIPRSLEVQPGNGLMLTR